MQVPAYWSNFEVYPEHPLIEPPPWEWLIADPTVLTPDNSPDGRWHLFAWSLKGIHHYIGDDGFEWSKTGGPLFGGLRPCIRRENDTYYLFYEFYYWLRRQTVVAVRSSQDLINWSEQIDLLVPEFPWEGRVFGCNGNPSLVSGDFGYRLYYSANLVFLPDCLFIEPKYIGVAEASSITGPYRKVREPLLSPDPHHKLRNFGAGAIKVYPVDGGFVGLNNGIYKDELGRTHSAIMLLASENGFDFEQVVEGAIVAPVEGTWRHSFVYALEVVSYRDELRMYFNGRDGWMIGKERIGCAISKIED